MNFLKTKIKVDFWTRRKYHHIINAARVTGRIDQTNKIGHYRFQEQVGEGYEYCAIDLDTGIAIAVVHHKGFEFVGWKKLAAKIRKRNRHLKTFRSSIEYRDLCNEFSGLIDQSVSIEKDMLSEIAKGRKKHG